MPPEVFKNRGYLPGSAKKSKVLDARGNYGRLSAGAAGNTPAAHAASSFAPRCRGFILRRSLYKFSHYTDIHIYMCVCIFTRSRVIKNNYNNIIGNNKNVLRTRDLSPDTRVAGKT